MAKKADTNSDVKTDEKTDEKTVSKETTEVPQPKASVRQSKKENLTETQVQKRKRAHWSTRVKNRIPRMY